MDFRHADFSDGWGVYEFRFLWKGEAIVRDSVLRRDSDWTKNRSENAFWAYYDPDDEEDSFLSFLKEVLESNEADYWEFDEPPDAVLGIYPDEFFPFSSYNWFVLRKAILNDDQKTEREVKEKLKKEKPGKLPGDSFLFIICANQSNFKGGGYGATEGVSLNMIVTREELERFAEDLQREYHVFKVKYKVGEYSNEEDEEHEEDKEDEKIVHGLKISYAELKEICDEEDKRTGPILKGADLALAEFSGYDLRGANLFYANLYGADLRRADLRDADLCHATLYGADLRWADLRDADLGSAHLYRSDLRWADLAFANLSGSYLRNAKLGNAKLYATYLYDTDLRDAKLRNADLRSAHLCRADLRRADLAFADLSGSYLRGADLRNANLYGADLRGAHLTFGALSLLKGANLVLAKLEGIMLERALGKHGANLVLEPLVKFL